MKRRVNDDRRKYWADLCIASSQVFLGVGAAIFFAGEPFDLNGIFMISLTLVLAVILALIGWRVLK